MGRFVANASTETYKHICGKTVFAIAECIHEGGYMERNKRFAVYFQIFEI